MKYLLSIIAVFTLLSSCARWQCTPPEIIARDQPSTPRQDSTAKIVAYQPNTNFSHPIDSTTVTLEYGKLPYTFTSGRDYLVTFYPANSRHTVTRLSFGNEKGNGSTGKSGDACNTSVNMVIDDSLVHYNMQDMNGAGGYVYMLFR